MADISKIQALDGVTYNIKDASARNDISDISTNKVNGITTSVDNHVVLFDGTNGKNIKDSGFTIGTSVPANAEFTDTTYTDATTSTSGLMSASDKTKLNGIAEGATSNIGTITGITMNGVSKGTSGVVDLGTVSTRTYILEYADYSLFPLTGEEDTLYIDTTTNAVYRWGGTSYIRLNEGTSVESITNAEIDALFT